LANGERGRLRYELAALERLIEMSGDDLDAAADYWAGKAAEIRRRLRGAPAAVSPDAATGAAVPGATRRPARCR
jgi:hypothetical protein